MGKVIVAQCLNPSKKKLAVNLPSDGQKAVTIFQRVPIAIGRGLFYLKSNFNFALFLEILIFHGICQRTICFRLYLKTRQKITNQLPKEYFSLGGNRRFKLFGLILNKGPFSTTLPFEFRLIKWSTVIIPCSNSKSN